MEYHENIKTMEVYTAIATPAHQPEKRPTFENVWAMSQKTEKKFHESRVEANNNDANISSGA